MISTGGLWAALLDAVHANRRAECLASKNLRVAPEIVVCNNGFEPVYMNNMVYLWLRGHLHSQISVSRFAHIHLPGDHIGDQARAVFAQQFDLPLGTRHSGGDGGGLFVQIRGDSGLLGEGDVVSVHT